MARTPERPTLRKLAAALDLSVATVSLALRNSPKISADTRARVRQEAERTGYRVHPSIAELMQHIRAGRSCDSDEVLALVNVSSHPQMEKVSPFHANLWSGIVERAGRLGFRVESFWWHERGMTPQRIHQILQARGLRGVLVSPPGAHGPVLDLCPDPYSLVTFGYGIHSPRMHRVVPNQVKNMALCLHAALSRGYRRIALLTDPSIEARISSYYSMVYAWYNTVIKPSDRVSQFLGKPDQRDAFLRWLEREKPEVLVSAHPGWLHILLDEGIRIPRDIGFIIQTIHNLDYLQDSPDDLQVSGVDQRIAQAGSKMVDVATSQMMRNEVGSPEAPQVTVSDVRWREGNTLRTVGEPSPAAAQMEQHM